eukprot:GHVU01205794.1.p1 GENE.GHVU01205794.1~~GHVU01205794.1.p1  ORF type:complete len:119 (+),score=19.82 GHVU01205794.1:747-1103(+)
MNERMSESAADRGIRKRARLVRESSHEVERWEMSERGGFDALSSWRARERDEMKVEWEQWKDEAAGTTNIHVPVWNHTMSSRSPESTRGADGDRQYIAPPPTPKSVSPGLLCLPAVKV